jgi:hypothetical protein
VKSVIDRCASNPAFLTRLVEDPIGLARTEGYHTTTEQVLDLLHLDVDSGLSLQEMLRVRLSQLASGKWW